MSILQKQLASADRQDCEQRRRFVADLESLAERLRADARQLRDGRVPTPGIAASEAGNTPSPSSLIQRRRRLERSIADIEAQIAAARNALAIAETRMQRRADTPPRGGARRSAERERQARRRGSAAPPAAGPRIDC